MVNYNKLYNTVLSQSFSPSGKYLFAGNRDGEVVVHELAQIYNPNKTEDRNTDCLAQLPKQHATVYENQPVSSMAKNENFLLLGTTGSISGWSWKRAIENLSSEPNFNIQLPSSHALGKPEVNSMLVNRINDQLYAGCGDNFIHIFDLEYGKLVRSFKGHTDYIHNIDCHNDRLVSGSEDGTVRFWDVRQANATNILSPFKESVLCRSQYGKWIGAVSINSDWMICGGGPRLSLWHLRSLELTTVLPISLKEVFVAKFHEDQIFAGGSGGTVYYTNYEGRVHAELCSSAKTVYSVELQESPFKVLSIAGSSYYIDLCTDFRYRDLILSFGGQSQSIDRVQDS